jgi:hypothetical protein
MFLRNVDTYPPSYTALRLNRIGEPRGDAVDPCSVGYSVRIPVVTPFILIETFVVGLSFSRQILI